MGKLESWAERVYRWLSENSASDTLYLSHHCNMKKVREIGQQRQHIRFPVSLAVQYDEALPVVYENFSLNITRHAAFIETESPLPEGSEITLHFYIPPEKKLLAEFRGVVVAANSDANHPHGMEIHLEAGTTDSLQLLEDYLDEHRHLLDQMG